jgi:hypothetical protein
MLLSNNAQGGYSIDHHILPEGLHLLEITTVVEGVYGQQQTPSWVLFAFAPNLCYHRNYFDSACSMQQVRGSVDSQHIFH